MVSTILRGKERIILGKDEIVHQVAASAGMSLKEANKVLNAVYRGGAGGSHAWARDPLDGIWNLEYP